MDGFVLDWTDRNRSVFGGAGSIVLGHQQDAKQIANKRTPCRALLLLNLKDNEHGLVDTVS
jgi:hypothetical protein